MVSVPLSLYLTRPLMDVWACCSLLDRGEDTILAMIEDGRIGVAFNIARRAARKRHLRIYTGCIQDVLAHKPARVWPLDKVLAAVLPGQAAAVRGTAVCRALNCSSSHVGHLLGDGSLRLAQSKAYASATPQISRQSVFDFLNARRLT